MISAGAKLVYHTLSLKTVGLEDPTALKRVWSWRKQMKGLGFISDTIWRGTNNWEAYIVHLVAYYRITLYLGVCVVRPINRGGDRKNGGISLSVLSGSEWGTGGPTFHSINSR